jgi:hypothetical protein
VKKVPIFKEFYDNNEGGAVSMRDAAYAMLDKKIASA